MIIDWHGDEIYRVLDKYMDIDAACKGNIISDIQWDCIKTLPGKEMVVDLPHCPQTNCAERRDIGGVKTYMADMKRYSLRWPIKLCKLWCLTAPVMIAHRSRDYVCCIQLHVLPKMGLSLNKHYLETEILLSHCGESQKKIHTLIQWIPFLMFETLNSCRRKLVCAKIMLNVGKNLSWCALLPNFKKNQKGSSFPRKSAQFISAICGGSFWGVTTSQIHSFLSILWHVGLRRWGTIAYR